MRRPEKIVCVGQNYRAHRVCANDVSARDLQYGDGQWFRGKNFAMSR